MSKDHAMWVHIDNIDEAEAIELQAQFRRDKMKIAPEGKGRFVDAEKNELPGRIWRALGWGDRGE